MVRAVVISLAAALAPVTAQACVVPIASCDMPDGYASLYETAGTAVLFHEFSGTPEQQRRRVVLAECSSRRAVMVEIDEANPEAFWAAESYMIEVMHDDTPQTLTQIARHLRRLGIDADSVTLGAQHCGCDLPNIPIPENYCPGL